MNINVTGGKYEIKNVEIAKISPAMVIGTPT